MPERHEDEATSTWFELLAEWEKAEAALRKALESIADAADRDAAIRAAEQRLAELKRAMDKVIAQGADRARSKEGDLVIGTVKTGEGRAAEASKRAASEQGGKRGKAADRDD